MEEMRKAKEDVGTKLRRGIGKKLHKRVKRRKLRIAVETKLQKGAGKSCIKKLEASC